MCDKTQAELLKEELFYSSSHASYTCGDDEIAVADDFCEGYKDFLDNCKTEREAVVFAKALAEIDYKGIFTLEASNSVQKPFMPIMEKFSRFFITSLIMLPSSPTTTLPLLSKPIFEITNGYFLPSTRPSLPKRHQMSITTHIVNIFWIIFSFRFPLYNLK